MYTFQKISCVGIISIFNIENFHSSSDSEEFKVYGNESIHILKDHYQDDENTARNQWDYFCFEMILIWASGSNLRETESNKLKVK